MPSSEDLQFIYAAGTGQTEQLRELHPYSKSRAVLVEATTSAVEGGHMDTLAYLLGLAPEGELNERAFLTAVQRGNMEVVKYMANWHGIDYKDTIDMAFEVADPRNEELNQFLITLEYNFVEGEQEAYEEDDPYHVNNIFIRQVLDSNAVDRPIVSDDTDERTDAITNTEIRRNSDYIICANPRKAHPYSIQSYVTWCQRSADCRHCPQCRLPMIPQRYLNKQGYRMTRRW